MNADEMEGLGSKAFVAIVLQFYKFLGHLGSLGLTDQPTHEIKDPKYLGLTSLTLHNKVLKLYQCIGCGFDGPYHFIVRVFLN